MGRLKGCRGYLLGNRAIRINMRDCLIGFSGSKIRGMIPVVVLMIEKLVKVKVKRLVKKIKVVKKAKTAKEVGNWNRLTSALY